MTRPTIALPLAVGALWLAVAPVPTSSQAVPVAAWEVRTVDDLSGNALSNVLLAFPGYRVARFTDDQGLAPGKGNFGNVRIVATRIGYAKTDTLLSVPEAGTIITLRLERSAIALPPITVEAERRMTSGELHQMMFDREIAVGSFGITQDEIRAIPPIVESDVLRTLQSFAGVTSVNDFTNELYVRGGRTIKSLSSSTGLLSSRPTTCSGYTVPSTPTPLNPQSFTEAPSRLATAALFPALSLPASVSEAHPARA